MLTTEQISQEIGEQAPITARRGKKQRIEPDEYGPAMLALVPQQRKFVTAYVMFTECDATNAARMAGYTDSSGGDNKKATIRVTGHRLLHDPRIGAAIREFALACAGAEAPIFLKKLAHIAKNDEHRDQVKALGMMLNRIGLPETVSRDVNVNITITTEQKVAEIRQMAEELGLDPSKLLGNVSDAEFVDVKPKDSDEPEDE